MVALKSICSVCGRRSPVYYRVESGDKLCTRCLKKSIFKKIKRTISKYEMLRPEDTIFYLVYPVDLVFSIEAAKIFLEVEERFPSKINLIVPSGVEIRLPGVGETLEYEVEVAKGMDFKTLEREVVREVLSTLKPTSTIKIVRPLPAEYNALLFLEHLYLLDLEFIAGLTPKYTSTRYVFINPFFKVLKREILTLAFLEESDFRIKGLECRVEKFRHSIGMLDLLLEHRELLHSTLYSLEVMGERFLKRMRECRLCGLPSLREYCEVHRR